MKTLLFQVEFKSDIVLLASSNTEGNIAELDFIPGSNFLGMVATEYSEFQKRGVAFDIFHSGKVRFGDATLLSKNKELMYKMPFSFFYQKLDENRIFHHHYLDLLDKEERKELGQLKQMRKGYILTDINDGLTVEHLHYNYVQKSAYDADKRRSKTSSMYGYKAIEQGTEWQFELKYDERINEEDIELLKSTLLNSKRLGKSKSSHYGEIVISEGGIVNSVTTSTDRESDEIIVYAKSRIALVDSEGTATYNLNCLVDGLSDENIVYDKCQIRTSTFTPYDGTMQTKTYERLVIEKGSVFVLQGLSFTQIEALKKGVGLYLAEGFGELLLNPSFLTENKELNLCNQKKKKLKKDQREAIIFVSKEPTVEFLINRHNTELDRLALADAVAGFIKDNKSALGKKMNAQWGTVRSLTLQAKDADELEKLLFEDASEDKPEERAKGFLMSKRAKDKWDSSLIENIKKVRELCSKKEKNIDYVQFIKLLSIDAPKYKEER